MCVYMSQHFSPLHCEGICSAQDLYNKYITSPDDKCLLILEYTILLCADANTQYNDTHTHCYTKASSFYVWLMKSRSTFQTLGFDLFCAQTLDL